LATIASALIPGKPLLETRNRGLLTVGVMAAQVMQILDTTIANVALPHMQASLGATLDTVTWVLTSYIVATAIALPATGWLSQKFGSRNLFLIAIGGFVIASMLCGIATNLEEMVVFRLLQGIFAAFINPLSQTALLDVNPPERHAKAMSIWGMGVMIGPILGPIIGGWLTESYNWRWCFYVNAPIGVMTFVILWVLLPSRPKENSTFDVLGFAAVGLTVAAFQLMLDRGQQNDWFSSSETVIEGGVALMAGWVAIVHLATARKPLFNSLLFKDRNFVVSLFFMVVIGVATMAPMALLPPLLQQLFGYPVIDAGIMMAPRGIGVLATIWIAGQAAGKIDTRIIIVAGLLIYAFSLRQMAFFSLEMDFWPVLWTGFIQGLGMGLVFMPLNSMAFATLHSRYRTDGASLLNLMRAVGQSGGISMVTVLFARNLQTSHADLASHITATSLPAMDQIARLGGSADSVLMMIDAEINRQAAMIAYLDNFYLMSWLSVSVVPLVFLLKKPRGKMEVIHSE
jgi:DHA2 family multidrug resistance protein